MKFCVWFSNQIKSNLFIVHDVKFTKNTEQTHTHAYGKNTNSIYTQTAHDININVHFPIKEWYDNNDDIVNSYKHMYILDTYSINDISTGLWFLSCI